MNDGTGMLIGLYNNTKKDAQDKSTLVKEKGEKVILGKEKMIIQI